MEFSIFSIGSAEFLEQILIALAMITGTNDFEKLCATGMLLGILLVAFQSILQNAKAIEWQQIIGCWVLYSICFGFPVTATIEDSREFDVRVVSNVPLGPVAVGSILSSVGHGITEMFEIAYSPIAPGITEKKFISSLDLLASLRSTRLQSGLWNAFDESMGGGKIDMRTTVRNYIADCTATKFIKGEITSSKLNTLGWREALKYESNYTTEAFIYASGPITMTCTDAWSSITTSIDTSFYDVRMQEVFRFMLETDDAVDATGEALASLSAGSVATAEFMKANMLSSMYQGGFSQFYSNINDPYASVMMFDAENKRNAQWGAEQELFTSSITSMMTVVEGFVYAITPFAAFIMVMGSKGIVMTGKYLQMLIWIQLWLPILSIVNLFIYTKGQSVIERYMTVGDLTSYESIVQVGAELERWVGIGSMMAASTPALAFFLVSGSAVAFNSMAQRMTSGNTVDPSVMSPTTLERGPLINQKMGFNQDGFNSTTGQGMPLENVAIGSNIGNSAASAQQASYATGQAYTRSVKDAISTEVSSGKIGAVASATADQLMASNSELRNYASAAASKFGQTFGTDAKHNEEVGRIMALTASGQIDATKAIPLIGQAIAKATGASAKIGGNFNINSANKDSRTNTESQATDFMEGFTSSHGQSSDWSQSAQSTLTNSTSLQNSESFKNAGLTEKANQYQRSKSIADSYSKLSEASQSAGISDNQSISAVGKSILGSGESMSALENAYRNMEGSNPALRDAYNSYNTRYRGGGASDQDAHAQAMFMALTNKGSYGSDSDYFNGSSAAYGAYAASRGANLNLSDFGSNSDIGSKQVGGSVVGAGSEKTYSSPTLNTSKVNDAHNAYNAKVSDAGSQAGNALAENRAQQLKSDFVRDHGTNRAMESNLAADLSGAKDGAWTWIQNMGGDLFAAAKSNDYHAMEKSKEAFYKEKEDVGLSQNLTDAQARYYAASHVYALEGALQAVTPDVFGVDSDRRINALNEMKLAEVNGDHTAYTMQDGRVVLNDAATEKYVNAVAATIDDAADTGRWSQGYLTQIGQINTLNGGNNKW